MRIRPARESDLAQLMAMSASAVSTVQWTEQQWRAIFDTQTPPRLAWIAEDDEMATEGERPGIGFLVALTGSPEWELENIAVLPVYRHQGVGQRLLSALLTQAGSLLAERILLEVRRSNQSAIHLYTGSGFQLLGQRRGYYQNPFEDALIMVRTLEI